MKSAAAASIHKFFPTATSERLLEHLVASIERLGWRQCQIKRCLVAALRTEHVISSPNDYRLLLHLQVTWQLLGNGVDVVISVTEEQAAWSSTYCHSLCNQLCTVLEQALTGHRAVETDTAQVA